MLDAADMFANTTPKKLDDKWQQEVSPVTTYSCHSCETVYAAVLCNVFGISLDFMLAVI